MKVRNGFVSNSSSSSFVVAFEVKTKVFKGKRSADLLKDILDEFSDKDQILISKERIEEIYELLREE